MQRVATVNQEGSEAQLENYKSKDPSQIQIVVDFLASGPCVEVLPARKVHKRMKRIADCIVWNYSLSCEGFV